MLEIITPALYYIHEYRLNHGQIGLVHICVYILLILSGRRNFSVRLNKEYEPTIRIPVPTFEGNYGDLVLLVGFTVKDLFKRRLFAFVPWITS